MISNRIVLIAILICLICRTATAEGPIPLTPPDDSRFWTGDPVPAFSWTDKFGAFSYFLEFDDTGDWLTPIGGFELDGTGFDLQPYLTQAKWDPLVFHLFWRVRGFYYGHTLGEPGPAFYFSKTTADPPEPMEPLDGTILSPWSYPVNFGWSTYPEAKHYWMRFGDDIEMSEPFGAFEWESTFLSLDRFISPWDYHYIYFQLFWQVSAEDMHLNRSPWGPSAGVVKLGYRRVMCYGDSITGGFGASDFDEETFGGYPVILGDALKYYDGSSSVTARWYPGGKAQEGAFNIVDDLKKTFGGIVIMMFGTVDIINPAGCVDGDCRTVQRLGEIVDVCGSFGVAPIVCTVIPYNPAGEKFPDVPAIQAMLDDLNDSIRSWCQAEGVVMADLDQAMRDAAPNGDLAQLYFDWAHPNDTGYRVMADSLEPVVAQAW